MVIQFEESEAYVKVITNIVKEALDTQEDVFLTDSQGNLLLDTSVLKVGTFEHFSYSNS